MINESKLVDERIMTNIPKQASANYSRRYLAIRFVHYLCIPLRESGWPGWSPDPSWLWTRWGWSLWSQVQKSKSESRITENKVEVSEWVLGWWVPWRWNNGCACLRLIARVRDHLSTLCSSDVGIHIIHTQRALTKSEDTTLTCRQPLVDQLEARRKRRLWSCIRARQNRIL